MSKKKIFAIVVFIVFGLFMFSFANPAEIENGFPVDGEVEVDKSKLKDAIDRGNDILADYGTDSDLLKELDEAVKNGEDVYEGESTQKEVDDATKEIEDAIKRVEDDIMSRATISLVPNTLAESIRVNLITTVAIDDNKFIDYVKLVVGTNCNANGTILTLNGNNQSVNTVNNNNTYTSCLVLVNGTTKQASVTVNNIVDEIEEDTIAPLITLNGNPLVKVVLGKTTYDDELAKVTDNVDEDREIAGEVEGNTEEIGTYELKYNASDEAGNNALEVVRTVKVLDPNGDEDGDGFTNGEEVDENTDFDDEDSHPRTLNPTITKKGNDPVIMLTDEKYNEAGVEITLDPHDKITTINDVVYGGSVIETTAGTYTLTYSITDRYANRARTSREVRVYDADGDEDGDGFTNREEKDAETDMFDEDSHPETIAPTITLKGNNPVIMLTDEKYSEAGVEITLDSHDKITTVDDVVYDGSVVETTAGTYTLTYTITDRYGKSADTTREVKVYDADGDEDGDGFTNREEKDAETDMFDENSHPETIAPTITLKGNNPVIMLTDEQYSEAGVEITLDPHDKITTVDDVLYSGLVVETTAGTYTLTYSITDRYGKSADTTREVSVYDADGDEDGDGFTNREEKDEETDMFDEDSHPETIAPTITLKGETPVYVEVLNDYTEAGVEITLDSHDKITTISSVVTTGSVDTNVLGTYTLTYSITDRYGKTASVTRDVIVRDTIAPVITLNGDANITLQRESNYVEAGATVTDNYDNNLSVVITGSVDINTLGTYTLKYNVTDSSNNSATEVTRTVVVVRSDNDKKVATINATLTPTTYDRGTTTYGTLTVEATDNDKTTHILDSSEYTVSGWDSSLEVGTESVDRKLTVTLNANASVTDTVDYKIVRSDNDKSLNRIDAVLTKVEYKRGEEISTLVVTAYDNDGTSYDVTALSSHNFDSTTVGNKTLNVGYKGKTDTVNYRVVRNDNDQVIASINATLTPTTYDRGTENYGTLTVEATDNDKTTHILDSSEYTVSGWDSSLEVGTESVDRKLTVTLKANASVTDTVDYKIVRSTNDQILDRIEATLTKTEYKRGEEISTLVVTAYDNDGTSYDVTALSGHDFDSTTVGNKTLNVNYNEKTDTVDYRVVRNDNDQVIVSINATLNPTTYDRGTTAYGTLTVEATDNDGTKHTLAATEYTVSGWDSSLEVGTESVERTLTVTLNANTSITDTVDYEIVRSDNDKAIKSLTAVLAKDIYKRGDAMSSITVTRTDNDGTTTTLTAEQYTLTGFSTAVVGGPYTLTVTHAGLTATDTYTVGDIEINIATPVLNVSGKKAEPGQTVDYEISLSTDMTEVTFPTYTIEIGTGMTLVCPQSANVTCEGNTLTWTPTSINEKLNYQTTVGSNVAAGTVIKTTVKEGETVVKEFNTNIEVTVEVSASSTGATSLEVVLTLDVSGSMWEEECTTTRHWPYYTCVDKPTKITDLVNVTNKFITDLNAKNTNNSNINLTIITFGRLSETTTCYSGRRGSDYSGCYETIYSGSLTSNTLSTIKTSVNGVIGTSPNAGGTPLYGAVNSALNIIDNSKLTNKYLVVLGDGEPTYSDSYGVITKLQSTKANVFSIGFKVGANSDAETVLKSIVNNNANNYFSADNATALQNSFATIQENINTTALQTESGNISTSATNAKSITLLHSGLTEAIEITTLTTTELAKYNIVIVDNKFVWDVSKYPNYTNFKMIVKY